MSPWDESAGFCSQRQDELNRLVAMQSHAKADAQPCRNLEKTVAGLCLIDIERAGAARHSFWIGTRC